MSFRSHVEALNRARARFGYLLVGALLPAGITLDWFTEPAHVRDFLDLRLIGAAIAVALLWLSHAFRWARHPLLLDFVPALIPAVAIELMILQLDGAASPYYAGLNLCIIAVALLYTWRWHHGLIVTGTILFVWLLPALWELSQGLLRWSEFYNNLYFLALTVLISVAAVEVRFKAAKREFDARAALSETSKELTEALARAQEVDRLKSEFFANISHELRTPLTLILSPVDQMLASAPSGPDRDALRVVRRNASRLLRMIDDLLDLARLEAGGLRLRVMQIDLAGLAERVFSNAEPTAKSRNITMTFSTEGEPPEMFGDPHRIEIILTNLVGNALKFTPDGGEVQVKVFHNAAGAAVEVTDSGPGISSRDKEMIFERFHQVEGSERRRQGGAGIGLALARELTQLHGGSLTVDSELGVGSTFTLFLKSGNEHFHTEAVERRQVQVDIHPARRAEDKQVQGEHSEPSEGGAFERTSQRPPERLRLDRGRVPRILVAEDENDLRGFIVSVLERDYVVDAAANGTEALALLDENRPDLVLTDVMMPETSGLDLCRAIKGDLSLRHIPVILLTARGENEAALEGYEAGADDFVSKPFHTQVLEARIRAHLKMRALSLQLADQSRLASAGTLAAGLAHEVKNPLNAAVNAVRVLDQGGSSRVPREKLMSIVLDALNRIDNIVSALGAHARPADGEDLAPCSVREAVESTLRLLEHKLGDNVQVHTDFRVPADVIAPARAFNQVLLNLVDNAMRSGAGNVWITVSEEGERACVAVSDDGPGVPPDVVHRIFDPFFTTRAEGDGTGLGLHLSRRIAQECGGELRYEPRPGGGARFVMEIPVMEQAA